MSFIIDREKLDRAMAAAGLSRYGLCEFLEITEPTLYRWARVGVPAVGVYALCHVLEVDPAAIIQKSTFKRGVR
jgi:hypothetical protein